MCADARSGGPVVAVARTLFRGMKPQLSTIRYEAGYETGDEAGYETGYELLSSSQGPGPPAAPPRPRGHHYCCCHFIVYFVYCYYNYCYFIHYHFCCHYYLSIFLLFIILGPAAQLGPPRRPPTHRERHPPNYIIV